MGSEMCIRDSIAHYGEGLVLAVDNDIARAMPWNMSDLQFAAQQFNPGSVFDPMVYRHRQQFQAGQGEIGHPAGGLEERGVRRVGVDWHAVRSELVRVQDVVPVTVGQDQAADPAVVFLRLASGPFMRASGRVDQQAFASLPVEQEDGVGPDRWQFLCADSHGSSNARQSRGFNPQASGGLLLFPGSL